MTTIHYFAWVREAVGMAEERVEIPASVATVADLIGWLSKRSAGHADAFKDRERLRVAIDQAFVAPDTPVFQAREIAIFPPVTGG